MTLYRCLREAVTEVERTDLLDQDTKKELSEQMRRILDSRDLSDTQKKARMEQATLEQRKEMFQRAVTHKVNQQWINNELEYLLSLDADERATRLRNLIENESNYGGQERQAVAARVRAKESEAIGQLNDIWHNITDKRVPWIRDSEFSKTFHQELRGVDTGDQKAKELVKKFRDTTIPLLNRLRKAGVWVGEIEDWGPQTHSPSRIMEDKDAWTQFLTENLDPEQHIDPRETAEAVYNTLMTRHLEDPQGATISMSRKLKFKSPDAEYEYFMRFGDGKFSETLYHNVRNLARKTVLAEELGPSPESNVKTITKQLRKDIQVQRADAVSRGDKKAIKNWDRQDKKLARTEWVVDSLTGGLQSPANLKVANFMGATRQWMITQFLGYVSTLLATQDSWISVFQTRFHTGGFGKALTEQVRNIKTVLGDSTARHWAEEMGVWTHALHAASVDRFATPFAMAEQVKGLAGQSATATQRMAGTYFLERTLRSATMMTISRSLARMSKMDWLDMHPKYRKVLEANGFTEQKWRQFRNVAQVDDHLGTVDVANLPQDLREFVSAYLYRETDLAVVYPQHYDRALLTMGGQAGTAPGELAATATQFWSWPIAFMRGPMRRELAMGGAGFAGFSAGMMAAGALATQTYALLKNEPTFEWDSPTLWARSAMRSGLLTPVGDTLMKTIMYDSMDIGPLGSQFDNIVSTVGKGAMDTISGDAENMARPFAQLVRDLTVPNLWWTDVSLTTRAMDYMMWELDPEYMRRRERRWRREGRRN